MDDLHSVELEKKLRLPDPSKAMETVWKMLRRTKQQMDLTNQHAASVSVGSASPGAALSTKKLARIEAERKKGQGTVYAARNTFR